MTVELVSSTTFVAMTCGECGCVFALSKDHHESLVANKHTFYCPNGHARVFLGKALRDQLAEAQQRSERLSKRLDLAERMESEARRTIKQRDRSLAATRGQVTKLRKRAQAGLCPYCNRHFEALERHVCAKHKDQPLPGESAEPTP